MVPLDSLALPRCHIWNGSNTLKLVCVNGSVSLRWIKSERCAVAEMDWVIRVHTPGINFEVENMNLEVILICFSLNIWPELLPSRCCQLLGRSSTYRYGTSWKFYQHFSHQITLARDKSHGRKVGLIVAKRTWRVRKNKQSWFTFGYIFSIKKIIIRIKLILDNCSKAYRIGLSQTKMPSWCSVFGWLHFKWYKYLITMVIISQSLDGQF